MEALDYVTYLRFSGKIDRNLNTEMNPPTACNPTFFQNASDGEA